MGDGGHPRDPGPRLNVLLLALALPLLLGFTIPADPSVEPAAASTQFATDFDLDDLSGFEVGAGWRAEVVDDAQRGAGALRLTLVDETGLHGAAARTSVAGVPPGAWFLTGWAKGTDGARLIATLGERSSAPVTLFSTWQAFGVTARTGGGDLPLRVVPDGSWEVGDSVLVDTLAVSAAVPRQVTVEPGTRIIEVDGAPYTVTGTNYNASPIGSTPQESWALNPALCQSDAALLRGAGVNTVRIWGVHPTEAPLENRIACLDAFAANGVGVLWLIRGPGRQHDPTRVDPTAFQEAFWIDIQAYVEDYAWHPATLFWSISNEVEVNSSQAGQDVWFGRQGGARGMLDVLAERLLQIDAHHLVGTAIADRCWTTPAWEPMSGANVPHLQYWGVNLYPNPPEDLSTRTCDGQGFFDSLNTADPRPKFVHEFGADRYHCLPDWAVRFNPTDPSSPVHVLTCRPGSGEDQAAMADWLARFWDTVSPHFATSSNPGGALSGGLQFKWSDDWWGVLAGLNPLQTTYTHEVSGVAFGGSMGWIDGITSPEWIGMTYSPDRSVSTPRPTTTVLDALATRWRGPGPALSNVTVTGFGSCASARVTWTTAEPATSELNAGTRELLTPDHKKYADSTRYLWYESDPALVTDHEMWLYGLTPDVEHQIVPRSYTADGRHATAPPLSFVC